MTIHVDWMVCDDISAAIVLRSSSHVEIDLFKVF